MNETDKVEMTIHIGGEHIRLSVAFDLNKTPCATLKKQPTTSIRIGEPNSPIGRTKKSLPWWLINSPLIIQDLRNVLRRLQPLPPT